MKIFIVERFARAQRDEAKAFTIIARDEQHAREYASARAGDEGTAVWGDPTKSVVWEIGVATDDLLRGVVCSDIFNA